MKRLVVVALLAVAVLGIGSYATAENVENYGVFSPVRPDFSFEEYITKRNEARKAREAETKKLRRHGGVDRVTCVGPIGDRDRDCKIYL